MTTHLYYSKNAKLAKEITELFFNSTFQVWSAPKFDDERNPPSSNPKDIFYRLHNDVKRLDNHSSKMFEIKAGLYKAIQKKKKEGLLTNEDAKKARAIVKKSQIQHFKPLLYLIPNNSTLNILSARIEDKAELLSEEYVIKDLKIGEFDIIQS
jgi:hypothetical protein